MTRRLALLSDPYEGTGAKRREIRLRIEGLLALTMAIIACGLTAAVWIQALSPLKVLLGLD